MTGWAVRTFLTMLVVIDPVGLVPMFLALAGSRDTLCRREYTALPPLPPVLREPYSPAPSAPPVSCVPRTHAFAPRQG